MTKLNAIIFDLEGTLLDGAADLRQGVNKMLEELGRKPLSIEQVRNFWGDGMMELTRQALLATGGLPSADVYPYVKKLVEHYRASPPSPDQVYPHVFEQLQTLRAAGVKMGICTNKSEGPTIFVLEQLGLIDFFGFVAGGDTFTVHKPNPGHVSGVLEALDVPLAQAVFVGDGPNDTVAAFRAGVPCIVVTHGAMIDADQLGASAIIKEFDELPAAIAGLGFEIQT